MRQPGTPSAIWAAIGGYWLIEQEALGFAARSTHSAIGLQCVSVGRQVNRQPRPYRQCAVSVALFPVYPLRLCGKSRVTDACSDRLPYGCRSSGASIPGRRILCCFFCGSRTVIVSPSATPMPLPMRVSTRHADETAQNTRATTGAHFRLQARSAAQGESRDTSLVPSYIIATSFSISASSVRPPTVHCRRNEPLTMMIARRAIFRRRPCVPAT